MAAVRNTHTYAIILAETQLVAEQQSLFIKSHSEEAEEFPKTLNALPVNKSDHMQQGIHIPA